MSNNGCEKCDTFWQKYYRFRPECLKTNFARHTNLYFCSNCDSFWEEHERFAVIISKQEVQEYYGEEFLKNTGSPSSLF
jgi:hypothetical protein